MRGYFLLLIFLIYFSSLANAQQNVKLNEVKKINLLDWQWSPVGVNRKTEFEIVSTNGSWACYQTKQFYSSYWDKRHADYFKKENSNERKFIKNVNAGDINSLLVSVKNIKPQFKWKAFNSTPKSILSKKDSAFIKNRYKDSPFNHQLLLNDLNNKYHIKQAINYLVFKDFWTDDYPTCVIEIIKTNNDTIKIVSQRQMGFMLPWMIDKVATYDLNINQFFISVMGDYLYSNKFRLEGTGMPYKIVEYINDNFTQGKTIKYDWQKKYPYQYKKLATNFNTGYQAYSGVTVTSKELPKKFYFFLRIAQGDSLAINNLIAFKDTVIRTFKRDNFVFRYYKNVAQAKIKFLFFDRSSFKYYGLPYRGRDIYKEWLSLPANKNYKKEEIIRFEVEKDNRMIETWLVLPDNKMVLVSYYYPQVAGITNSLLDNPGNNLKQCIVVFDDKGNILSKYY